MYVAPANSMQKLSFQLQKSNSKTQETFTICVHDILKQYQIMYHISDNNTAFQMDALTIAIT